MARPKKPTPEQVHVELNTEALQVAAGSLNELALIDQQAEQNTSELATFLGYDGPLQAELLEHGIAQQMRRTVDACLEMGKMLLLLKERVGHGNFEQRLEHLGIDPRAARRFMQSAYKLSNRATSPVLTAIGTQSKLFELLVLDDQEMVELVETGSVLGVHLDEIECMGTRELREALRKAREEGEAKDRLLAEDAEKMTALREKAARKFKHGADQVAKTADQQAVLDELAQAVNAADLVLSRLGVVVGAIEGSDVKALRLRGQQAMQFLVQRVADVIDQNGIEVSLGEQIAVRPEWLDDMPGGRGQAANG